MKVNLSQEGSSSKRASRSHDDYQWESVGRMNGTKEKEDRIPSRLF